MDFSIFKASGPVAVGILTLGLIFLVRRWPGNVSLSFSQHAARHETAIVYYNRLFLVVVPLLLIFFVGWFGPHFHMPALFYVAIVLSGLAQVACTFIPETGGRQTFYHRLLAGISAILIIPTLFMMFVIPSLSPAERWGVGAFLATTIVVAGISYVGRRVRLPAMLLQIIYFAAYLGAALFISYAH